MAFTSATGARRTFVMLACLALSLYVCGMLILFVLEGGVMRDFRILYDAARAVRLHTDLYPGGATVLQPNLNPPHLALLMMPLGLLPIRQAAMAMWAIDALCILVIFRCALVTLPARRDAWTLLIVLLMSAANQVIVILNQLGWIIAAGSTIAWLWVARGKTSRAAFLIGVLASFKVFFLLFLPYWIWRRAWRSVGASAIGMLLPVTIGMLVTGPSAYLAWITNLRSVGIVPPPMNISLQALCALWVPRWMVVPSWIGLCLIAAVVTWQWMRTNPGVAREWASVFVLVFFFSPLAWVYYLPLVAVPLAATGHRRWLTVGIVLALLPWMIVGRLPASSLTRLPWSLYTLGVVAFWFSVITSQQSPFQSPGQSFYFRRVRAAGEDIGARSSS